MDLGLKGLLAKTEATMAEKEGGSSVAAISLQPDTSADQLNVAETTTRTTTTLPAIPSPEQKREKNMNPQDIPETGHDISGSLADWNFQNDSQHSSRPQTTQSRGQSRSDSHERSSSDSNNHHRHHDGRHDDGRHDATGGIRTSKSTGEFTMTKQFDATTIDHRPSTVSELTQPRMSLGNNSLKMSPFGVRSKSFISEAERLCSEDTLLSPWLMKGGVQRAVAELGMDLRELHTRSLKDFSREPGRPMRVSFHIQELRYV